MTGSFSEPHICQCLNRIAALRRSSPVVIYGERWQTGQQFVDSVLHLAGGLWRLGLAPGDVVAISAFNRCPSALFAYFQSTSPN
ncbi:hypothetical protein CDL15_Pgr006068 [Punica granatum]|uniref:AMP-dependent synthetase/ligase domain-containing protein n=1 Tax=Punica granatum TaxID=22663 RepID=A0A218VTU3_PUNGR|nr:hypothetical protein CDL15_Pgr006068 [Punica granatum]